MNAPLKFFVDFQPLHAEQKRIGRELARYSILRCGRRWGKTRFLETKGARRALAGGAVGWFTPNYKLLRPSYRYIATLLQDCTRTANRSDFLIELHTGGLIEFWSMEDEDAGRSRGYDLAIIDEASLQVRMKQRWEQSIAPTLLERRGSAIMAGTPKGIDDENYFYLACTQADYRYDAETNPLGWKEFYAPTSSSPLIFPEDIEQFRRSFPPDVFRQEYLAEFVEWSGKAFFALPSMLAEGAPPPLPKSCDLVFVTIDSATKTGREHDGTGAIIWAYTARPESRLTILDWDYVQIEGSLLEQWLPGLIQRAQEFAAQIRCRFGFKCAFIEDKASGMILLQQARRRGLPAAEIESKLTAVGKDERAISVSGYVFRGWVKIAGPAYEKTVNYKGDTANHLLKQVVGYHVGQRDRPDDLLDCFTYGIAIAMGNAEGF